MKDGIYNELSLKCKQIISSNTPNKSIELISNIKLSNGSKVGKEIALKIYKVYADESVEYDVKKDRNNITTYVDKIQTNISIAEKKSKKK